MNKLGIKNKIQEQMILLDWNNIAGPQLAKISRPKTIKNGIIFVVCYSPVWMQELTFRKKEILDEINRRFNYNYDIKIMLGNSSDLKKQESEKNNKLKLDNGSQCLTGFDENWINGVIESQDLEKDLKIKIKELMVKDLKLKKQRTNLNYSVCSECGRYIENKREMCVICSSYFTRKRMEGIMSLLADVPWLKKEDLNKYFSDITSQEYNRARKKVKDKVVDEVYTAYFAYKNKNTIENFRWLKNSLNNYVLVTSQDKPENISESTWKKKVESLNENIYKIFYKKE